MNRVQRKFLLEKYLITVVWNIDQLKFTEISIFLLICSAIIYMFDDIPRSKIRIDKFITSYSFLAKVRYVQVADKMLKQ